MLPSEDVKLQVLNDHYKDTFVYIQNYIRDREWYFTAAIALTAVMTFEVASPKFFSQVVVGTATKQFGVQSIDLSLIGSVVWFLLLGAVVKYLQRVFLIDKQYSYIHSLEEELSAVYEGKAFTREGRSYLHPYPLFQDMAHQFYRRVFPFVVVLVAATRLIQELSTGISLIVVFDSIMFCLIAFSLYLYIDLLPLVKPRVSDAHRVSAELLKVLYYLLNVSALIDRIKQATGRINLRKRV